MTPTAHLAIHTSSPTDSAPQLAALLQNAGLAPLETTGWIRVTGDDRVRWLNGMVTNSIQDLKPGEGNYNFFLSVQGRIQGDANIFATPDALLIETATAQIPTLLPLLDRFIIMDDVELADISTTRSGLSIKGPQAASLLQKIGLPVNDLGEHHTQTINWNSAELLVIQAHSPLVPSFELWTDDAATTAALSEALLAAGVTPSDPQSHEWLRILSGTPLYGTDIRNSEKARELPQETAQTRALHFSKGCYLGQEIVERIRSRGNVHRTFAAFRLEGPLPSPGTLLEADNKQVGELTSIAAIPLPGPLPDAQGTLQLALGYIRREALDRGAALQYPGGTATVVPLPYPTPEISGRHLKVFDQRC